MKYTFFETESGKKIKTAEFNGYKVDDKFLEDLMFQVTIQDDGTLKVWVKPEDQDYFSQFNTERFLKKAQQIAEDCDVYRDPVTEEDCWFQGTNPDSQVVANDFKSVVENILNTQAPIHTPVSVSKANITPVGKNGIEMDGIPKDIQDIIKKAGSVYQVGENGGSMTLGVDGNGDFSMSTDLDEVDVEEKPKVLGRYKSKTVFHDFLGTIGNINLLSKTAQIKGKYFDSLNLENVEFKMTLCDNNTFDFEEIVMDGGEKICTEDDIKRYIRAFEGCSVVGYRSKSVISDMIFTATHTVKDKEISVTSYLVVDPKKPYDDLLDFMDEPGVKNEVASSIDIDELNKKIDDLFSDFEDSAEPPIPVIVEKEKQPMTTNGQLMDEFLEAKKEKREILRKKMENFEKEYKSAKNNYNNSSRRMSECLTEIQLLTSRIDSLDIAEPINGYYFYIPEFISESSYLQPEVKQLIEDKLLSMNHHNVSGFMKLFENSLYRLRFGLEVEGEMKELFDYKNIYPLIKNLDPSVDSKLYISEEGILYYEGQINWSTLSNKLIKLGFQTDHRFEELCKSENVEQETQTETTIKPTEILGEDEDDFEDDFEHDDFDEDAMQFKNDDFLFAIYENESASNVIGDAQFMIGIVPKSFYDKQKCMFDGETHDVLKKRYPLIEQLGDFLSEESEGTYALCDSLDLSTGKQVSDIKIIVNFFCKAGLKFDSKFQSRLKSMSGKDITSKIVEVIENTGNSESIIA